jgi:hypothetical protein
LPWSTLDLRTLRWTLGFESTLSLTKVAASLPLLALLAAYLVGLARGRSKSVVLAARQVAPWSLPLVALPLIVFTLGVLGADAVKTDSWTLTRQNLQALRGDPGCGLAGSLAAGTPASMHPLSPLRASESGGHLARWVPAAPVASLPRLTLGPVASGDARSPWFAARPGRPIGVFAAGPGGAKSTLALEFARVRGGRARVVDSEPLPVGVTETADGASSEDVTTWRFLSPDSNSPRANAVRVVLRGQGTLGNAVAVTTPVTYQTDLLTRALDQAGTPVLTNPYVQMFFPCLRQPRLRGGTVAVPAALVAPSASLDPLTGRVGGIFNGLLDLYPLVRLPLVDPQRRPFQSAIGSHGLPGGLALYEVDTRIPGAEIAPPSSTSG